MSDTDGQRSSDDLPTPAAGVEATPCPREVTSGNPTRGGGRRAVRWVLGGFLALISGGLARAALPALVDDPRVVAGAHRGPAAAAMRPPPDAADERRDDRPGEAPSAPAPRSLGTENVPVFASAPAIDEDDPPDDASGASAGNATAAADPPSPGNDRPAAGSAPPRPGDPGAGRGRSVPRARRGTGAWRPLLAAGASSDAWAAARNVGPAEAAKVGRPSELLVLADAARRAGESNGAADIYEAIRDRFPGHPAAAVGAYRLGRLAFGQGRFRQAARWFHTYVGEVGAGERLAADARGRELEALHRAGDDAAARQAATDYLERYPSGPYARLARELVEP